MVPEARRHAFQNAGARHPETGTEVSGESFVRFPRLSASGIAAASVNASAAMAGRQRRGNDSGDRGAQLRFVAVARRQLIERHRRVAMAIGKHRGDHRRKSQPAAVRMHTVTRVL